MRIKVFVKSSKSVRNLRTTERRIRAMEEMYDGFVVGGGCDAGGLDYSPKSSRNKDSWGTRLKISKLFPPF